MRFSITLFKLTLFILVRMQTLGTQDFLFFILYRDIFHECIGNCIYIVMFDVFYIYMNIVHTLQHILQIFISFDSGNKAACS